MIYDMINAKLDDVKVEFNVVYAKNCGVPKNCCYKTRLELVEFFMNNLNDINFLSINDVIIDINKLANENISLSRYLKLNK